MKLLFVVDGGKTGGLAKNEYAGEVFLLELVVVNEQKASLVAIVVAGDFFAQGSQVVGNAFGLENRGLPWGRTLNCDVNLMFWGRANDVYPRFRGLFSTENWVHRFVRTRNNRVIIHPHQSAAAAV